MNSSRQNLILALAMLAASFPVAAGAQSTDSQQDRPSQTWQVAVGPGAVVVPEYEGGRDLRVLPVPAIDVSWRNRIFLNNNDGLGVYAVNNDHFSAGVGLTYGIGRSEGNGRRLRGLGEIKDAPRPRAFARAYLGPVFVGASVARDIGGSDGLLGDVSFGASIAASNTIGFTASVSATYADRKHMQAFFGVSQEQALASGLPAYRAKAGLKRADATVGVNVKLSPRWALNLSGGAGRLLDDAARSPIVERKWQPVATAGLLYNF
jgi:MipA family protein